jgi:hypothetical protein
VDPSTQNLKNILDGLSEDQCKQLAAALVHLSNPTSKNIVVFANAAGLPNSSPANSILHHSWILDSGATDHILSDSSLLVHSNTSRMSCVNLPTGSSVPIDSTGTILFNKNITLDNVLHVPSFHLNLMSASKLIKSLRCCIILFPDFCVIQGLATGKMIGWGKQDGGLYYMSSASQAPISCHITPSSALWHQRLGHPLLARLKLLSSFIPSMYVSFDNKCHVCPMAKQTRSSFPSSNISTSAHFSLLHCDIWGPHRISSHFGARYFLTIVDDFTRCTWVFLMSSKSDTQPLLKSFFLFVRTQFNVNIKIIRTDNGSEFLSMKDFFLNNGVEFQRSCVYTPQQNGVVERKHRYILNIARALRFQSNLPLFF